MTTALIDYSNPDGRAAEAPAGTGPRLALVPSSEPAPPSPAPPGRALSSSGGCAPSPLGRSTHSAGPAGASTQIPSARTAPAVLSMHRRWAPISRGEDTTPPRLAGTGVGAGTAAANTPAPAIANAGVNATHAHRLRPKISSVIRIPAQPTPPRTASADTGGASPPASPIRAGSVLARAMVEVLCGMREMAQLERFCDRQVFAELGDIPMLGRGQGARLVSVWVCQPRVGVAELSASFQCCGRVRAMALRLNALDGQWRIVALQLG